MGGNRFRFKRFEIDQEGCAMKVGTDGVLLGAWCRILPADKLLLDIGSGTGIIALQLAQRTEQAGSTVEAVEIDSRSCEKAQENFDRSGWGDRLTLHCSAIQDFAAQATAKYDHIVSNPPYYNGSMLPADAARRRARHTSSLAYEELAEVCSRLLNPSGRVSIILPAPEAEKMAEIAARNGFHLSRRTEVWSTPKSGPKRLLLEFARSQTVPETSSLVIEDEGPGSFSAEYRALTRDFYLYF